MVGLGRVVLTRRERVVMLEAFDKGLLATALRYAYEVREPGAYFEDIPDLKLPAEMSQLAGHIIETKAGHFDPKKFEDHYENALVELLRKKQAGRVIEPVRDEGAAPQRVINLMDALRASIGAETQKKPAAASTKARAGAAAGQEEGGTLTRNAEPDREVLARHGRLHGAAGLDETCGRVRAGAPARWQAARKRHQTDRYAHRRRTGLAAAR